MAGFWPDKSGGGLEDSGGAPLKVPCKAHAEWADRFMASRELAKIKAGLGDTGGGGLARVSRGGGGPGLRGQHGSELNAPVKKYGALVEQVGDAVGMGGLFKNWVTRFSLGEESLDGAGSRFFCPDPPGAALPARRKLQLLADTAHPRIVFAHPVKNVHVELMDLGRAGDAEPEERLLWNADYALTRRIQEVSSSMPSEGGDMPRMRRLCPPSSTPWRMELHVTADDPRASDEKSFPDPDRGVDETLQYEVRLLPEGHPMWKRKAFHDLVPPAMRRRQPYLPFIRNGPSLESAPCGPREAALLRWTPHRRLRPHQRRGKAFL